MSNPTVPAAAEGMRSSLANQATPARIAANALEPLIDKARMSARLHSWLVGEILGGALRDDDTLHVSADDRELLVFSAGQSQDAAEAANAAYLGYARTVR